MRDAASTMTEPAAAAVQYASTERLEPGEVVAVYDLGGGTFDAALLRKQADGFELLGRPEGLERTGGIDFDEAVFGHVAAALGDTLTELSFDDPRSLAGLSRLRADCVAAKEALSSDTDVAIPVFLPTIPDEVRPAPGAVRVHDPPDAGRHRRRPRARARRGRRRWTPATSMPSSSSVARRASRWSASWSASSSAGPSPSTSTPSTPIGTLGADSGHHGRPRSRPRAAPPAAGASPFPRRR